jgi:molybdopterin-containing oxidoreductase family iron-sulfur binding subunit
MSNGIKRRDFLKVVGVGGATAGLAGCEPLTGEKLLPYVVPPEDVTPSVATWYTSTCGDCSAACGIWVRTREGRVVKLEGNPNHPVSQGALCSRGHASIQGLYNPDRYTGPMQRVGGELQPISWDEAEALLAERIGGAGGNVLYIGGAGNGPTMTDLVDQFLASVGGSRVEWEALNEAPLREATRIAFGQDVVPHYDFEEAEFIVSFGADFVESWLSSVEHGRTFARATSLDAEGHKAPFVFVGPRLNLTGQNADEWVPIPVGAEAAVALGMASVIAGRNGNAGPYASVLQAYSPEAAAEAAGVEVAVIRDLAERFAASPSIAVGPGYSGHHRNATAANLAVHILNAVAGNVGTRVHLAQNAQSAPARPYGEFESAIRSMASGGVGVALVHGTNPAYTLPAGSGFVEAFRNVPFKVSFAMEPDETSALADLILPDRHFLESWGDASPRPGIYSLQQPAMEAVPHFDSKQTGDVLLSVAARAGSPVGPATTYEHIRNRWQQLYSTLGASEDFEAWWRGALKKGVVEVPVPESEGPVALRQPDASLVFDAPSFDGDGEFVLMVYPSGRFGDGKDANKPWLQEVPDTISKIGWHGWVEIHPNAAERLGVDKGDVVSVSSPHGSIELPVFTYPGIREDTVAVQMGMGRENSGRYANGNGVNAMRLLAAEPEQPSGGLVYLSTRVTVVPTGEVYRLATIEGSDYQSKRGIAPAAYIGSLHGGDHSEEEGYAAEGGEGESGYGEGEGGYEKKPLEEMQMLGGFGAVRTDGKAEDWPLPGTDRGNYADPETPRWAMAIDLDKCTGCSACIVACQSENNVAFVGEDQVRMGRDLAWIRLERYYETVDASHAGTLDIRHIPVGCQHCNNAPCEPVCPVVAAYHTPDGLNGQVYNRCVGTRYCANNCPYKVRVYNWYTYSDVPEPLHWQYNPDVTIRNTGIMEKCSFCVQRIRSVQNAAAVEGRPIRDGEMVPACQQSCPAEAIVFGNIKDESSRVKELSENERTYRVLDELINTQPAVHYLKKVTFHETEDGAH